MEFIENFNLKEHNTFGFPVSTRWYAEVATEEDLNQAISFSRTHQLPLMILGGGSNVLFTQDWEGLVLHIRIMGREVIRESGDTVWVRAGAGENWHDFVLWAIEQGFSGIENLSLIPGCCGAAPMQNIGAYGVELKDVFQELQAYHIQNFRSDCFSLEACKFGYRESIFKQELRGQYVITSITLRLSRTPQLKLTYGDLSAVIRQMGVQKPGIREVSQAVMYIRNKKLPNPKVIGNAGSFFKNPVISSGQFAELVKEFPNIPHYHQPDGIKIPAAWLIEQCGWKGKFYGNVGVNQMQPLVLVNFGFGRGSEILSLSNHIRQSIREKFAIDLNPEVNVI